MLQRQLVRASFKSSHSLRSLARRFVRLAFQDVLVVGVEEDEDKEDVHQREEQTNDCLDVLVAPHGAADREGVTDDGGDGGNSLG